jgi:hypothetical protein
LVFYFLQFNAGLDYPQSLYFISSPKMEYSCLVIKILSSIQLFSALVVLYTSQNQPTHCRTHSPSISLSFFTSHVLLFSPFPSPPDLAVSRCRPRYSSLLAGAGFGGRQQASRQRVAPRPPARRPLLPCAGSPSQHPEAGEGRRRGGAVPYSAASCAGVELRAGCRPSAPTSPSPSHLPAGGTRSRGAWTSSSHDGASLPSGGGSSKDGCEANRSRAAGARQGGTHRRHLPLLRVAILS